MSVLEGERRREKVGEGGEGHVSVPYEASAEAGGVSFRERRASAKVG